MGGQIFQTSDPRLLAAVVRIRTLLSAGNLNLTVGSEPAASVDFSSKQNPVFCLLFLFESLFNQRYIKTNINKVLSTKGTQLKSDQGEGVYTWLRPQESD